VGGGRRSSNSNSSASTSRRGGAVVIRGKVKSGINVSGEIGALSRGQQMKARAEVAG
jgi:hypothetical protein